MSFLYYVFAALLYVLALPFLLYLRFKPKYKHSIPARFFLKNNPKFLKDGIWFHACSLGEVRSLKPFLEQLAPYATLHLSVITQTGYKEALTYPNVNIRYLPFEIFLPFWVERQKTLVVMEAELWPMLFIAAKCRNCKTILLNARISDRSYASYKRFAFVYRWIFKSIDVVFAQSNGDKERLESLGARNVLVEGNVKALQTFSVTRQYVKESSKRVIVLASTHEKEEELILSSITLKQHDQLIVVPRHPERFVLVDLFLREYAHKNKLTYAKASESKALTYDVILCDCMGELINYYAIADIVFLGGSFVEGVGGHNPLEPAYFQTKIISGEHIFNQKVLYALVENIVTCKKEEIREVFNTSEAILPSVIVHRGDSAPLIKEILG